MDDIIYSMKCLTILFIILSLLLGFIILACLCCSDSVCVNIRDNTSPVVPGDV